MRQFTVAVIFTFFYQECIAQVISEVNFDEVKVAVSDSTSNFYYPTLVNRFLSNDTNLTANDYHHLYYGNIFQDYYYPYGASEAEKKIKDGVANNLPLTDLEVLCLAGLKENPVNLDAILKLILVYNLMKNTEMATLYAKKYVSFLEVIYASGRGQTCENSFVVISVDDEYYITSNLGLEVKNQFLEGVCDRLYFSKSHQKGRYKLKSLYFNVRIPLTYLSKSYNQSDLPPPDPLADEDE
jgi:hypothetical protein